MFLKQIRELDESLRLQTGDDVKRNDPVVLAYIGDSLYDLYVRCRLAFMGDYKAGDLHKMSIKYVCAFGQSRALEAVTDILNEEELNIVRRARNAKATPPKNCDRSTYMNATAFEAMAGYLYLSDNQKRVEEIFGKAFDEASAK